MRRAILAAQRSRLLTMFERHEIDDAVFLRVQSPGYNRGETELDGDVLPGGAEREKTVANSSVAAFSRRDAREGARCRHSMRTSDGCTRGQPGPLTASQSFTQQGNVRLAAMRYYGRESHVHFLVLRLLAAAIPCGTSTGAD